MSNISHPDVSKTIKYLDFLISQILEKEQLSDADIQSLSYFVDSRNRFIKKIIGE